MEEVVEVVVVVIWVDKLVYLIDSQGVIDQVGELFDEMIVDEVVELLSGGEWLLFDICCYLLCVICLICIGVGWVYLISYEQDGVLLCEFFIYDGVGIVIICELLENICEVKLDDIVVLIVLIELMEEEGILVYWLCELFECEIEYFFIMLYDGIIVGCVVFYFYFEEEVELVCLVVSFEYCEWGYGEQLMKCIEKCVCKLGIKCLFVLMMCIEYWFVECGFKLVGVDDLLVKKCDMYNYQWCLKVFFKIL